MIGRLDKGAIIAGMPADSPDLPSRLGRRLWCDSLTYNRQGLQAAVEVFGRDHVVFGSDYPFPVRPLDDIVAVLLRTFVAGSAAQSGGILWRNSWVWA
jgi:aminocarboxymuconate-semialdehyde decarboxylase